MITKFKLFESEDDGKFEYHGRYLNLQKLDTGNLKIILTPDGVEEATEGMEVAISIPGMNFERQLKDKEFLYSDITPNQLKNFKKNKDLLSSGEMRILQEIAEIKKF